MNARQIYVFSFVSILTSGCVLSLNARISEPVLSTKLQTDKFPDGHSVQLIAVNLQVSEKIDEEFTASLHGYKCGGDDFKDSVGGGRVVGNTARILIPLERLKGPDHNGYDMNGKAFDVCLDIRQPDFPFRRQSNTLRINSSEISRVIANQ